MGPGGVAQVRRRPGRYLLTISIELPLPGPDNSYIRTQVRQGGGWGEVDSILKFLLIIFEWSQ